MAVIRVLAALGMMLALAGCATPMTEAECRGADWYQLGERDALVYGVQPQVDLYADQCSRHGVQVPNALYMTGWRYGYSEHQGRMGSGGGGGGGSM